MKIKKRIQDKYNTKKIWVVSIDDTGAYKYNQENSGKLLNWRGIKTTKEFLDDLLGADWDTITSKMETVKGAILETKVKGIDRMKGVKRRIADMFIYSGLDINDNSKVWGN